MAEEYTFERISARRLSDIRSLYRDCFNEDVLPDFLQKKYDTSFAGISDVGYIAYHESGAPAAYYGVFPCKAVIGGKAHLCAQSGDTMTHPDHRGKGLFIKLAKLTYELAKTSGIQFVFGFPNKNSYHGFVNKLGWTHKENFNLYMINIYTFPLAYVCSKVSFLNSLYRGYANRILKSRMSGKKYFDNPLAAKRGGGVLRDENFFDYKKYSSKELIEINGTCVYIKAGNTLRIGDIEETNKEIFFIILKKLKRLAWVLGCPKIYFYYSPGVKYDSFLSHKYRALQGLPIGWVDLGSGLDLASLKFAQADHDIF